MTFLHFTFGGSPFSSYLCGCYELEVYYQLGSKVRIGYCGVEPCGQMDK